ncbi:hypothetical protein D9Q98_004624 [Chlorella vulgaris]|uniref:Uncharacterized protein n=1 Tax=Chlorella vulgaris TaxID=3077 RepID=A0A9D4TRA8_CHLVU|nr:hypothetical protein D9Q98_004624 [Chlorella vulgaris]
MRQRCDSASELHRTPHSPSIGQGKLGTSPPPRRRNLAACETKPRRLQIQQLSPAADGGGDAAIKPTAASPHASAAQQWGSLTDRMVSISTIPFLFLFLPQLLKNHANQAAGNTAALAVLSWLSYLTGLGGNTLLLSYFASKFERNAVLVQALGIASSFAVLTQIRVAGYMPRAVYSGLAVVVGLQAILTGLKLSGRLDSTKGGQRLWSAWQKVLGLAGLAGVPQVLWATFQPHSASLVPCQLTLAAGCAALVLEGLGMLPPRLRGLWAATSACAATMLFMLQPVSQLVRNFQDPASLQGLSLATILLASAGNGLMVPRALWTRDWVWLTGCLWGSLFFGWAQMLSMFLGISPATGQRFLSAPLFAAFSVVLWGWLGAVLVLSGRARRKQAAA